MAPGPASSGIASGNGGDVAHVLLDRLLGGLAFAAHAHAEHHFGRDREQQQAAGDAERRQRNVQRVEKPIADQRGADEDRAGDDAGPTATPRRAARGRPSVTARKVGARPIGSTTTNSVSSAETA